MRRVSVVGNSGSGKSTLARRVASVLDAPYIELDAIHHLPNWQPIDPAAFVATVGGIAASDRWVIDGNYRTVVVEGPVWERADTVVWLDLPRAVVMRQLTSRTFRRAIRREELWNGNREQIRHLLSWDPNTSLMRWAWTQHAKYRDRFATAARSPQFAHLTFVRLTSRRAVDRWLASLAASRQGGTS